MTEWKYKDKCRAVFSEDGVEYEATIKAIDEDSEKRKFALVRFVGYGNEENIWADELLPSKGEEARKQQRVDAGAAGDASPNLTADPNAAAAKVYKVGDFVRAVFTEDNIEYEAVIKSDGESDGNKWYCLEFLGYLNQQSVWQADILESKGEAARKQQEAEANGIEFVAEDKAEDPAPETSQVKEEAKAEAAKVEEKVEDKKTARPDSTSEAKLTKGSFCTVKAGDGHYGIIVDLKDSVATVKFIGGAGEQKFDLNRLVYNEGPDMKGGAATAAAKPTGDSEVKMAKLEDLMKKKDETYAANLRKAIGDKNEAEMQNKDLKKKVAQMEEEMKNLKKDKEKVQSLEKEKTELAAENAKYKAKVDSLSTEKVALATEANALKTKVAALEKELENAKKSSPKIPSPNAGDSALLNGFISIFETPNSPTGNKVPMSALIAAIRRGNAPPPSPMSGGPRPPAPLRAPKTLLPQ